MELPKALIKAIKTSVEHTTSISQLYETFIKYKAFIHYQCVLEPFVERLEFVKTRAINQNEFDQVEELKLDIEIERSIVFKLQNKTKTTPIDYQLNFNTEPGKVYQHALNTLVTTTIDRFKGHKASIVDYLGITTQQFENVIYGDKTLRNHYDTVRRTFKTIE
jgi:hypothetical protein